MDWQHRLSSEFKIPPQPTDDRALFDEVYHCLSKRFLSNQCIDRANQRGDQRLLNYYLDRLLKHPILVDSSETAYLAGLLGRSDLIERLSESLPQMLVGAVRNKHQELVQQLINQPDHESALSSVAMAGDRELTMKLIKDRSSYLDQAAALAIHGGNPTLALEILDRGRELYPQLVPFLSTPRLALVNAAKVGDWNLIQELIKRGAGNLLDAADAAEGMFPEIAAQLRKINHRDWGIRR